MRLHPFGTEDRAAHGGRAALALALMFAAGSAEALDPYPGKQPEKFAASPTVLPGGTITWTVRIYNDALDADTLAVLADDIPDVADGLPMGPFVLPGDLLSAPPGSRASYDGDSLSITDILVPARGSVDIVFRSTVTAAAADGTSICNGGVVRYDAEVCSGSPELCSAVTYRSTTRPPGSTTGGYTCVTVNAPTAGPDVQELSSSVGGDRCPSDPGFPPADGAISPGELVDLTLLVNNLGDTDAVGAPTILGTLRPGLGYTIVAGSSPYTTSTVANRLQALGANTGTNSTPFSIRVDPELACPGTLTVTADLTRITGEPWRLSYDLPVSSCARRCLDVGLTSAAAGLRDDCPFAPPGIDGKIDPGDDVFLVLPIANSGPDDLSGTPTITGTLRSLTAGVTLLAGRSTSSYPDIPAAATRDNLTEFGIHVAESLACGARIDLELTLATAGGPRVIAVALAVGSPCATCAPASCSVNAVAAATGPTAFCVGDSVRLDAGGSILTGCAAVPTYQWYRDGSPVGGATLATYDLPTTLLPSTYGYSVEVTCPSVPGCTARSVDVIVNVLDSPRVVSQVQGYDIATTDVFFTWAVELSASGGYRVYRTDDPAQIPLSRCDPTCTPGVIEVATTIADPAANSVTDPGAVPGPANQLYCYQVLALCVDQVSEGPN